MVRQLRVGRTLELSDVPDVAGLGARLRDGLLRIRWDWPEKVRHARVVIGADCRPNFPEYVAGCVHVDWSVDADAIHEGLVRGAGEFPRTREYLYVVVYAKRFVAGQARYSPGLSEGCTVRLEIQPPPDHSLRHPA